MTNDVPRLPLPPVPGNAGGFSLVEILVALTLLVIAGTFVAGNIFQRLEEGQVNATKIQMGNFAARLQEFRRKCGFFPSELQGLHALVEPPSPNEGRECRNYPEGGFIGGQGTVPLDPWENEYQYTLAGRNDFNIHSFGPDGYPDEEGGDQDDIYFKERRNADAGEGF